MNVPLSLYVHLPWCVRKCPYCDFNSHTAGPDAPRSRYLDALCRDLSHEAEHAGTRTLDSLFIGGGTPSLFSGAEIGRLLDTVRERFMLAPDIEITMEANPGSVERHNLAGYRSAGVNRLSLGAQSFSDRSLKRLGRVHGAADIGAAFRDARDAGFDNVNLDLMFALPGQTLAMARTDVARAIELAPEHVSYYQLTLEPNTVFFARPPADLPDDDRSHAIQEAGHAALAAAGYRQYEISAFAKRGRACRHNLNYWSFGDYLAAGAGAHGKWTDADGRIWRYRKPNNPTMYMIQQEQNYAASHPAKAPPAAGHTLEARAAARPAAAMAAAGTPALVVPMQQLSPGDIAFEYLLNVLRLPAGFSEQDFRGRTGLPIDAVQADLAAAAAAGLMEQPSAGHWRPSARGLRFLNDLQARFLPIVAG